MNSYLRTAFILNAGKKSVIFTLVFSLVLSAVSPAFAENASSTKSGTKKTDLGGEVSMLMSGEEGGSLDVSRNLYNFGRYSNIDELSGTYNFEIPIIVPPGRNGVQPELALQYNSQPQFETSVVGYGWSISIPFIERINRRGTDRMFTDTEFYSTLSGELASTSATTYKTKFENGDFITYEFSGNIWTATDKLGTIYKFGHSAAKRQDHPSDSSTTTKWMIDEIRDLNGNYITFEYHKDQGQIYPASIAYTHSSTSADGIFEVEFVREARNYVATSSAVGFQVITKDRISQITTKVNGSWVRKYELDYSNPENRTKSLLTSITEYGRADDGSTTTRPAYKFSYKESAPKGWATDASWIPPIFIAESTGISLGAHFADVNGDGRPDFLQSLFDTGVNEKKVYLNNGTSTVGSGWSLNSSWTYPWGPYFTANDIVNPFFPVDLNADGYDDMIYNGTSTASANVYINNKSGWATSTSWQLPTSFVNAAGMTSARVIDVNGDSLPDVLKGDATGAIKEAYVNTGSGWATSTVWLTPQYLVSSSTDLGVVFLELNGDGLPDLLRSYSDSTPEPDEVVTTAYLNTGAGWATSTTWNHPDSAAVIRDNKDTGYRFVEINADGHTDMIRGCSCDEVGGIIKVNMNTNTSWLNVQNDWNFPSGFTDTRGIDSGARLLDLNADLLTDFIVSRDGIGEVDSKRIDFNTSKQVDVLSQIVFPQGGTTTIQYKSSHLFRNGSTMLNTHLPYPILTVSTTTELDGKGNSATTSYSYEGGKMYWGGPYDRRFAGFSIVTKTDPQGQVTKTYFHQASSTESSLGEYEDHVSKIGKVYRVEQYDNSNNLFTAVVNKWDKDDLGNGRYFVKLTEKLTLNYDGDSDHRDIMESFTYASGTGNIVEKINWGEVIGTASGTYTDTGSDKFTTTLDYATSTTFNIYALPSRETVVDQNGNKVRESKFYYDELSLGNVEKGNLTKQEMWVGGSTYIDVEKTYNSYGLVATEKDARDKTTTYTYDSYNLYPATTTNPVSHITGRQFDYSSGKVRVVNDPNNHVFETTYDGFDRVVEEKQPDLANPNTLVTRSVITYTDTGFPTKVQRTDYLNPATSTDSYSYFDGYGRKIEDRIEAEGSNTYIVKEYVYNKLGQMHGESLPHLASSTSYAATTSNRLFIWSQYDSLGRIKTIANVVGTTTNTYDDWRATTTDSLGNTKSYSKDAYGNLVVVLERNNNSSYITTYEYNGNNKLTKITDAEANVRNFTYDGLGRRLTAQDVHDAGDGTFGTWTFTYDSSGNIASTTDPKSQVVSYTYDDINRVLTEDYAGAEGTEISYSYDSCTNGIGRICSATSTDAVTNYQYSALGQLSSEIKILNNVPYITSYVHDRLGNKTDITYPDNAEVQYVYNTAGQLEIVRHRENGGTFVNIVSNFDYGPHNFVTAQVFGNGVTTTKLYDINELYRLRSISTISTTTGGGVGGNGEPLIDTEDFLNAYEAHADLEEETPSDFIAETISESPQEVIDEEFETFDVPTSSIASTTTEVQTETIFDSGTMASTTESTAIVSDFLPQDESSSTVRTLTDLLESKSATEKARLKGLEIAKLGNLEETVRYGVTEYRIEIVDMTSIDQGVELYARVWNEEGKQIGFGTDGTVDLERFRIINPPILVEDPNGPILRSVYDQVQKQEVTWKYREDPKEALLQSLAHTLSVKSEIFDDTRIISGKIGKTTTIVYPDAHPETSSVDGNTNFDFYSSSNWSALTSASASVNANDDSASMPVYVGGYNSPNKFWLYRAFVVFNTSSIGNDTVASATLSIWPAAKVTTQTPTNASLRIVSSSPASSTSLSTEDFDQVGSTALANDKTVASISTGAYTDFALNVTGIENIVENGTSKFAIRHTADIANEAPQQTSPDKYNGFNIIRSADQTGTTNDPKLVIEHSFATPTPTSTVGDIQNLTYTYDAAGNITQIDDNALGGVGKRVSFVYDNLYRLIQASTTAASSSPYRHTFTYSSIGNMTGMATSGATTTYSYAETNYANPHAPTTIGGDNLTYDNNGNVLTFGGITYTWDYRNRMTATGYGGATTTYAYDHTFERVKKVGTSTTTYYPNDLYSKEGATSSKFIFDNAGTLLATVEGNGVATSTKHHHQDHLGGTNVVTDTTGATVQIIDYYPYGSSRIETGDHDADRTYVGEMYDPETNLSYLNARYYDGGRGQFLSQDPVFWEVMQNLINPQSLNSYSYAENNPIRFKDPSGRAVGAIISNTPALLRALAGVVAVASTLPKKSKEALLNSVSNILNSVSDALRKSGGSPAPQANTPNTNTNTNTRNSSNGSGGSSIPVGTVNTGTAVSTPYTTIPIAQPQIDTVTFSFEKTPRGTPKPQDAPSGTIPIDKAGLSHDDVEKIKELIGAGRNDWTGKAPNGDIITGTPDGKTINHGPVEPY